MIPDGEASDGRPHLFDHTSRFVPQHHRCRAGEVLVEDRKIAVADSAGVDTNAQLVRAERRKLDLLDLHGGVLLVDNGSVWHPLFIARFAREEKAPGPVPCGSGWPRSVRAVADPQPPRRPPDDGIGGGRPLLTRRLVMP